MASPMVELLPQNNNYNPREGFATRRLREMQQRQMQTPEQPPEEMMMGMQQESESPLGYAARTAGRTVARAGEEVLGLPGNLIDLSLGLGSALTGGAIPTYGQVQEKLPLSLPTSGQVKSGLTEKLTGDYLKPRTSGEEYYDDLVGTTASLLIPSGGGLLKGGLKAAGKTVAKNAALALTADLAGRGTEHVTGSPLAGGLVKVGSLVLGSTLAGSKRLTQVMDESYDNARSIAKAKDLRGETTKLNANLNAIENGLSKATGITAEEEGGMMDFIGRLLKNIGPEKEISAAEALAQPIEKSRAFVPSLESGAQEIGRRGTEIARQAGKEGRFIIPGEELSRSVSQIPEELQKSRFFFENGKIKLPSQLTAVDAMEMLKDVNGKWDSATKGQRKVLGKLNGALNDFIDTVGRKSPDFLKNFKEGQELFRAKAAAPELLQRLNDNISFKKFVQNYKPLSAIGYGVTSLFGMPAAQKGALGLGALLTGKHAWNLVNVIQKSPRAAKHYRDLMQAAARNNAGGMVNAFRKLDKEAARISS